MAKKTEYKIRYDIARKAVQRAIAKNKVADFPKLKEQIEEFPTLKSKYGPQLEPKVEPKVEPKPKPQKPKEPRQSPNGDPFDTLFRRQHKQ